MKIQLFYDALQEAEWFKKLSKEFKNAIMVEIGPRGKNPEIIDSIIEYDRPDIILMIDDEVKFVLEKTEGVPTGHAVGQRFARIARAAELHLPFIYFLPFAAQKHGNYASPCFINARLFPAVTNMGKIHNTPILVVNWKCDEDYELLRDGTENQELIALVQELFENHFDFENSKMVKQIQAEMKKEYEDRIKMYPSYEEPPKSVKFIKTEDFLKEFKNKLKNISLPEIFLKRKNSLLYYIGMSPASCRREDPFTGTQLIYDYLWCRTGELVSERHTNLILDIPNVKLERWEEVNPDKKDKKRHLYYSIPDLLILKNGAILTGNSLI